MSVAGLLALAACNSDSPDSSDGLAPGGEPTTPVSGTFRINPDSIVAEGGAAIQFVALDSAADGSVRPAAATWTASSGSIDSTGLYVAPAEAGKYQVTGRSADGTVATSNVSVEADAAQQVAHAVSSSFWVEITPGNVTLSPGQATKFSAVIKTSDNKSLTMRTVWQATGGSITTAGDYTAPSQAGTYQVIAIREGDSMSDTRSCQVVVRLYPSKSTEPSITATKATVPGVRSVPARPVSGHRKRMRPSSTWSGASSARRPKRTANASPLSSHVSRPNAAMPNSAMYV